VASARRRAAIVAVVLGVALTPWFLAVSGVSAVQPDSPAPSDPSSAYVDFYAHNAERIAWNVTLMTMMWAVLLGTVIAVVRAGCRRLDTAAITATCLATAATGIYVMAEGVFAWPVVQGVRSEQLLTETLDPEVARALVESRDGLHAPAAVLLGLAVLVIGWLLLRGRLWGHWATAAISVVSGALALSSVVVGPEGLGPGLILLVWVVVVPILLLIGLWRADRTSTSPLTDP
jgi:hypothetical protein